MMATQIEPQPKQNCPLCGARAETNRGQGYLDPPHFFVQCTDVRMCGARGPSRGDPGSAVATWDKREARQALPAEIEWIPVEQSPDQWMRALVKLKDGTITLGLRQNYYIWIWTVAVVAQGYGNQGAVWSNGDEDDIVAFWPLPEK